MKIWLAVVAVCAAFACGMGASPRSTAQQSDPPSSSPALQLTVTLTELSQGPTLTDLPEHLAIAASKLPMAGESIVVSWQALDGDPTATPRQGSGSLAIAADGLAATITLDSGAPSPSSSLTMSGTVAARSVSGSFVDRLFSARAGKFTAEIQ